MASRGQKRAALSETSELTKLREQVLAQMAELSGKSPQEMAAAATAQPEATVMELGLNSSQGISLKGWFYRELEAELTTFQALKQPLSVVIEAIDTARRDDVGVKIPDAGPRPPADVGGLAQLSGAAAAANGNGAA